MKTINVIKKQIYISTPVKLSVEFNSNYLRVKIFKPLYIEMKVEFAYNTLNSSFTI